MFSFQIPIRQAVDWMRQLFGPAPPPGGRCRSERVANIGLLILAILIYFALDRWIDLPPIGLVFYSETIQAIPHGDSVEFECQFEFHATHPHKTGYQIFFPTHQEGTQAPPGEVVITVDGRSVTSQLRKDGFSYLMPVTPGAVSRSTIRYTIPAPGHKAVYVTRTANLWPRPPATARFILSPGMRSNYHSAPPFF